MKLIAATQNVIDYLIFGVLTAVVNYLGSAGNGDSFMAVDLMCWYKTLLKTETSGIQKVRKLPLMRQLCSYWKGTVSAALPLCKDRKYAWVISSEVN